MLIKIISIGNKLNSWESECIEYYKKQLPRNFKIEFINLKSQQNPKYSKDEVIMNESKLLMSKISKDPNLNKITRFAWGWGWANGSSSPTGWALKSCEDDLANITGQKPVITKFKKSIANFKTRKNTNSGLKVTLRKNKMYEFLDRLINIALPRIKDFRGLSSKGFDKFGNYSFGIKEHIVFPEVNFDKVEKIRGLDITIAIKSINKEHGFELLKKLNFPFIEKRSN